MVSVSILVKALNYKCFRHGRSFRYGIFLDRFSVLKLSNISAEDDIPHRLSHLTKGTFWFCHILMKMRHLETSDKEVKKCSRYKLFSLDAPRCNSNLKKKYSDHNIAITVWHLLLPNLNPYHFQYMDIHNNIIFTYLHAEIQWRHSMSY